MCERVYNVRTTCVAYTHKHTFLLSHGVNKGWQHELKRSDLLYFIKEYINDTVVQYFNMIFNPVYFFNMMANMTVDVYDNMIVLDNMSFSARFEEFNIFDVQFL